MYLYVLILPYFCYYVNGDWRVSTLFVAKIDAEGATKINAFKTIRQTAALGILPEHRLRIMYKENRLPGIYSGSRFLVNVSALIEQLNNDTAQREKENESNDREE